jgi:hypothetical protein
MMPPPLMMPPMVTTPQVAAAPAPFPGTQPPLVGAAKYSDSKMTRIAYQLASMLVKERLPAEQLAALEKLRVRVLDYGDSEMLAGLESLLRETGIRVETVKSQVTNTLPFFLSKKKLNRNNKNISSFSLSLFFLFFFLLSLLG